MNIYATADLHGNLPDPPADADLLLLAGDICPDFGTWVTEGGFRYEAIETDGLRQAEWLDTEFRTWLGRTSAAVGAIWGNHDYVGEHPHLIPDLPWLLLQDTEGTFAAARDCDFHGDWDYVKVWGTPWVPGLPRWAFHGHPAALEARADLIPQGIDILLSHGPPYYAGDFCGEHVGERELARAINEKKPSVVICGHIHEGRGSHHVGDVPVLNVAAVDEHYKLHANPWRRVYEHQS